MENNIENKNNISLPFFIVLCKHLILNNFNEIEDDLKIKLLSNYKGNKKIIEINDLQLTKIIYFNQPVIHKILHDPSETIHLHSINEINISFLFYLDLIILNHGYSFPFEYIKNIDGWRKKMNDEYKLIITSKIIIDLIHYYKFDEKYNAELEKMEDENKKVIREIRDNIIILEDIHLHLNENYIINNKIDIIYSDIICALIKQGNFNYYENIIKQLDLENITLTKSMKDELSNILNENDINNNNLIKEYIEACKQEYGSIYQNESDLDNNIIFEIMRNDIYLNNYRILNREDLLNENKINFWYILLKYILKDSNYKYQISFFLKTRNVIKILITELKDLSFDKVNKNIREKLEYIIMNITDSKYYLNPFLNYFKSNSLKNILINNIDIRYALNKDKYEYKSIIELIKNNLEDFLTKYFNNEKMNKILRRILTNEEYEYIKVQINKNESKDKNSSFSNYSYSTFNSTKKSNINDLTESYHGNKNIEHFLSYSSYIKELSNGQFIIGGKNCITLYDQSFNYKDTSEIGNDNIYEIENNNNSIELIICLYNKINNLSLIKDGQILLNYKINEIFENLSISFALKVDKLIICTNKGVYNYNEENNQLNKIKLLTQNYYGGIKINNHIIALITNEIQNKESNLIFYNLISQKIYKIKEENSLKLNIKLPLLSISENNYNVLLCACKSYIGQQNNGILLINLDLTANNSNLIVSKDFYYTPDFEVRCFCAYSSISNNNVIFNQKNIEIKEANYILVGGYDKSKGNLIKLYNIIYENKKPEIKHIRDIDFSEYNNLKHIIESKSPITDIKQSKIDGRILIRFLDGNVYLMSKLNI